MAFQYSEVSHKQKKKFYTFLAVYVIGFVLLGLIGRSINEDGFVILGFLAPFSILIGIIGIVWFLLHPEEDK